MLLASGNTASPLFVQAKLHESALGIVFSDYAVAERAALEAIRTASATMSPRSIEVATGLQQLSHVYTLTQRRELAVEPARQAFDLQLEIHARDLTHPKVMESTLYYGQALNSMGDFDAAFALYREASANAARVFGEDSRIFGESLSAIVPLEIEIGALEEAIAGARRAIAIYLKEGEPDSRWPSPQAGERPPCGESERRGGRRARGGPSSFARVQIDPGRAPRARKLRLGAGLSGAL
jgi:tetratricopeptide (TPR) repeat protein